MQSYIASYITRNLLKITKKSNCSQNIHLNAVDGQRLQRNYVLNKKKCVMDLFILSSYELMNLLLTKYVEAITQIL